MKQDISALMDGELCGDEADELLGKIKRHPEAQQEWLTYHLIGDALRQPDYISMNMHAAFVERLHAEPTVLAPHSRRNSVAGVFAMSAVASIMAIAFLAWLSVKLYTEPAIQMARQPANAESNVSLPINEAMNDYLLAHKEFSPSSDVRGAASYIRTVAVRQTVAGQ
ncbi:MAG TPA: sigma-E factor negative regulatory protein [Gallionellaceae bacterium]|nr:sigma-E factor negative regulatory protein [Gallionellaceae bacterium]